MAQPLADRITEQCFWSYQNGMLIAGSLSPSTDAREDWLRESAKMYEIYNKAYCNLSATASASSAEGLFRKREPHTLWEDEVNLNLEEVQPYPKQDSQSSIQRCVIQDLSFWKTTVNDAPVNRRGWVLQERMMAPRVIHFCRDQIAWECNHLEAAESAPDGIFSLHLQSGVSPATNSIPHLGLEVPIGQRWGSYGSYARKADTESIEQRYAGSVEHWQIVIERYSKTRLTNAEDQVIALSGYARMKSEELPPTCSYLAGMWSLHLESQLLWRVDPVFTEGKFEYPSNRPGKYRAPSWSWAAVCAPQGITCGEISDIELLFKAPVEKATVRLEVPGNKFGLVAGGELELVGILKEIELTRQETNGAVQYGWNSKGIDGRGIAATHSIVYLDSPDCDTDILGSLGRMYIMPARKDSAGYLICLLLQLEHDEKGRETKKYRRVGLAKVSPNDGGDSIRVVCEASGYEASIPWSSWNEQEQKHHVCIV